MPDDGPLLAVGANHDLGCSGEDHVEVVGGVPLAKQILACRHCPSRAKPIQDGNVGLVKGGKRDRVLIHECRIPSDRNVNPGYSSVRAPAKAATSE